MPVAPPRASSSPSTAPTWASHPCVESLPAQGGPYARVVAVRPNRSRRGATDPRPLPCLLLPSSPPTALHRLALSLLGTSEHSDDAGASRAASRTVLVVDDESAPVGAGRRTKADFGSSGVLERIALVLLAASLDQLLEFPACLAPGGLITRRAQEALEQQLPPMNFLVSRSRSQGRPAVLGVVANGPLVAGAHAEPQPAHAALAEEACHVVVQRLTELATTHFGYEVEEVHVSGVRGILALDHLELADDLFVAPDVKVPLRELDQTTCQPRQVLRGIEPGLLWSEARGVGVPTKRDAKRGIAWELNRSKLELPRVHSCFVNAAGGAVNGVFPPNQSREVAQWWDFGRSMTNDAVAPANIKSAVNMEKSAHKRCSDGSVAAELSQE